MRRRVLSLTVAAGAAFLVLIGLGTWQLQRREWKEGLIAARDVALAAAPVELPTSADAARDLEFHRVRVTGTYLYDRTIFVHAIERAHGDAGYLALTPMRLASGGVVLVERGWIPPALRDATKNVAGNPAGEVALEGILRLAPEGRPGSFVPDNDPARGEWYYIDLATMARAAGVPEALPFYVEAGSAPNPGGYPVG
ncbi:MAG TPA: SURF1 family cytochrome oxidase biogenesis protein, partial [Stellaceae bacterium]|nr:SURF1 family cytochrome oxidase biogenesis protein [Stellaceae bacterium]